MMLFGLVTPGGDIGPRLVVEVDTLFKGSGRKVVTFVLMGLGVEGPLLP